MTDTHPLPGGGPEKAIFLEALRRMSRDCEPPELLPECPFSVDLTGGGRGCGEECERLLAEFGSGGRRDEEAMPGIPGMGFSRRDPTMRRRRHAASPSEPRAFDAAEIYLSHRDDPDRTRWVPTALVYELRELVAASPALWDDDRLDRLHASALELRRRGVDPDLLVRHGFGPLLVTHLAMASAGLFAGDPGPVIDVTAEPELAPGAEARIKAVGDRWTDLLDEAYEHRADLVSTCEDEHEAIPARIRAALAPEFSRRIFDYIMTAPIEAIYGWEAPTELPVERALIDREERRRYTWVADRFSETYEGAWHPDSLREEWGYLRGIESPPFPRGLLESRSLPESRIAQLLADRTYGEYSEDHISTDELKSEAVRFLRNGRREAAVAVFEAAKHRDPDNAELVNNFGFCLTPDNPVHALEALEKAERMGFSNWPINTATRVMALHLAGRHAAALELAERLLDATDGADEHPESGYLWHQAPDGEVELVSNRCPRCFVAEVAHWIASQTGDAVLEERWEKRRLAIVDEVCSARP